MKTIKDLTVEVKYRVGLGYVEVPKNVYEQLMEATNNGDVIDPSYCPKYPEAAEWLTGNIRERDCMDWECEIEDIS